MKFKNLKTGDCFTDGGKRLFIKIYPFEYKDREWDSITIEKDCDCGLCSNGHWNSWNPEAEVEQVNIKVEKYIHRLQQLNKGATTLSKAKSVLRFISMEEAIEWYESLSEAEGKEKK